MTDNQNFSQRVVFLHPRISHTSTPLPELLGRLNLYGIALNKASKNRIGKLECWIGCDFEPFSRLDDSSYSHIKIKRLSKSANLPIMFTFRSAADLFKYRTQDTFVVGGDLGSSLIVIRLLRLFFKRIKFQISVHGEISKPRTLSRYILYSIRKINLNWAINESQSLRVVSNHLADKIIREHGISHSKIVISPIPISLPGIRANKFKGKKCIGVIGRLHAERGVEEAMEILAEVLRAQENTQVIFVGSGPELNKVKHWVAINSFSGNVTVMGHLNVDAMREIWNQVDICLSCAPSEGYGMTIREALLSGVAVIARESDGTLEARSELSKQLVLFKHQSDGVRLLISALNRPNRNLKKLEKMRQTQHALNEASLEVLARSWMS